LIQERGYTDEELPTLHTITTKVNQLGYKLKKVKKVKPLKKIEQKDAIFNKLKEMHEETKDQNNVVRLSIDTKDRMKIGDFSRGGTSRVEVRAMDHDFSKVFVPPFGILDVTTDQVALSFTHGKVTADFMVDAIEREWGRLEQHWNGDLLRDEETVYAFAQTMIWKGKHPVVSVVEQVYETGKKLSKKAMDAYEKLMDRDAAIGKWFVTLTPEKCKKALDLEFSP